jgi:hypothetical protein
VRPLLPTVRPRSTNQPPVGDRLRPEGRDDLGAAVLQQPRPLPLRLSYARYSEGQSAHWLLLVLADRVDAWEHHLRSFLTLRPDNPLTETGVRSEFTHHGLRSRIGHHRADLKHQWLDPIIVAGPWVATAWLVFSGARRLIRPLRS